MLSTFNYLYLNNNKLFKYLNNLYLKSLNKTLPKQKETILVRYQHNRVRYLNSRMMCSPTHRLMLPTFILAMRTSAGLLSKMLPGAMLEWNKFQRDVCNVSEF